MSVDDLNKVPTVVLDIVFDGAPGPEGPQFLEVEDGHGRSISIGHWIERKDGTWVLRIPYPFGDPSKLADALGMLAGSWEQAIEQKDAAVAQVEKAMRLVETSDRTKSQVISQLKAELAEAIRVAAVMEGYLARVLEDDAVRELGATRKEDVPLPPTPTPRRTGPELLETGRRRGPVGFSSRETRPWHDL